jgi:hypothetical protein
MALSRRARMALGACGAVLLAGILALAWWWLWRRRPAREPPVARSRRARMVLGACAAVLLAGILGLAWWLWRHRSGRRPPVGRLRRTRAALVAVGLLVVVVGATWRLVIAVSPVPECSPPEGPLPASPITAQVVAEKLATWVETGIGMLYSQATGAHLCFSRMRNYYVALNADHIAGARAVNMGDVVLKPDLEMGREQLKALVKHEAAHRTQWAVGTVIGGPLAFPVAYGVTYFFFPGARNPFEHLAGLESGGYTPAGAAPVLGPPQLTVLSALGAIIVVTPFAIHHRRAAPKSDRGNHRSL